MAGSRIARQIRKQCSSEWELPIMFADFCSQPKLVTESDEAELAKQMERLERENAEVDGDDDNPDEEEVSEDLKI